MIPIEGTDYFNKLHSENKLFNFNDSVSQYIHKGSFDPHLTSLQLKFIDIVKGLGLDCKNTITRSSALKPYHLIAFGAGDGTVLEALIRRYQPQVVTLAVVDWHDFASSFWKVDWKILDHCSLLVMAVS